VEKAIFKQALSVQHKKRNIGSIPTSMPQVKHILHNCCCSYMHHYVVSTFSWHLSLTIWVKSYD